MIFLKMKMWINFNFWNVFTLCYMILFNLFFLSLPFIFDLCSKKNVNTFTTPPTNNLHSRHFPIIYYNAINYLIWIVVIVTNLDNRDLCIVVAYYDLKVYSWPIFKQIVADLMQNLIISYSNNLMFVPRLYISKYALDRNKRFRRKITF